MDDELQPQKKIDVESEVGMSRRDLLRRSAVVGGALLWAAPAIQSVGMKAAAAYGPSPGSCSACYCYTIDGQTGLVAKDIGVVDDFIPGTGQFTADDCENWCKWISGYNSSNGAPGGPYANHSYCSGSDCVVADRSGRTPLAVNPTCS